MQPFDNESRNLNKFYLILALNLNDNIKLNVHFKQILFHIYSLAYKKSYA